jgi:hypothetical protein
VPRDAQVCPTGPHTGRIRPLANKDGCATMRAKLSIVSVGVWPSCKAAHASWRRRLAWLISSFFARPAAAWVLQWLTSLRASVRFFRRQRVLRQEVNRRESVRFRIMRCNLLGSWLLHVLDPCAAGKSSEQFTIRHRRRHKFEKLDHHVNSLVGRLLKHFWNNILPLGTPVAF